MIGQRAWYKKEHEQLDGPMKMHKCCDLTCRVVIVQLLHTYTSRASSRSGHRVHNQAYYHRETLSNCFKALSPVCPFAAPDSSLRRSCSFQNWPGMLLQNVTSNGTGLELYLLPFDTDKGLGFCTVPYVEQLRCCGYFHTNCLVEPKRMNAQPRDICQHSEKDANCELREELWCWAWHFRFSPAVITQIYVPQCSVS